jgi:hypothetical protein
LLSFTNYQLFTCERSRQGIRTLGLL